MMTLSEINHMKRVCQEIVLWHTNFNINGIDCTGAHCDARIMPGYLLVAYVQNLLDFFAYAQTDFLADQSVWFFERILKEINKALLIVSTRVMSPEFEDIETRAAIMDLFHKYGYDTYAQHQIGEL